jgi:hypothetical protein
MTGLFDSRQTAHRRRRARGAVAIEALIVSSLLVSVLAAGVFVHRAYATKLRVIREARVAAWQPALKGCASLPGLSAMAPAVSGLGDESGTGNVSDDATESWVSVGDKSESRSGEASGNAFFRSYSLSSKESVACNPVTSDEEGVLAIVDVLVQTVKQGGGL